MALQVYLDSSDYSVLSDPKAENKKIEETKIKLFSFIDRGDIEIRFSNIHVFEMAHTGIEHRELALKRFEVLEELCQNKTLLCIQDMENLEIATLAKDQTISLDVQLIANNNGRWFPDIEFEDPKQFVFDGLSNQFKKMKIHRKKRIELLKHLFRRGNLTDVGYSMVSKNREPLNQALSLNYPLTERFWKDDFLLQYLKGSITKAHFMKELQNGFFDPKNLVGWYIDRDKKGLGIPQCFRDISTNNIDKISDIQQKYKKLYDLGIKAQKSPKEIQQKIKVLKMKTIKDQEKFRKNYLNMIWNRRQQNLLKFGVSKNRWISKVKSSTMGQTPSIDFFIQSLLNYGMNSASNPQNSRKLLNSDNGDLMHGRYIPYVDIFRADRNMGHLFAPLARPYNTRIVTSFFDLPTTINEMLCIEFYLSSMLKP